MARAAALLGALLLAAAPVAAEPPTAARAAELDNLLRQDCGSCHGMSLKGGLGPPLLPAQLAGRGVDEVVDAILFGRPGTPMPPWEGEISHEEAAWMARRLKGGW